MTREEAEKLVLSRMVKGVNYDQRAIETAINNLLGLDPPKEEEPIKKEPEKISPFIAHTYGLHEKYFPDG